MLPHMIKISPSMPILLTSSWFNSPGNALIFVSHQHPCKSLPGRTDSLIGKWKSTWRAEVENKPSCRRELHRCIRYHGGGIVLSSSMTKWLGIYPPSSWNFIPHRGGLIKDDRSCTWSTALQHRQQDRGDTSISISLYIGSFFSSLHLLSAS